MNYSPVDLAVFFVCAVISAMGMGGGGLVILYLITVGGFSQLNAQGVNLLFFIPCCLCSILLYIKSGYIKPKTVIPLIVASALGAVTGSMLLGSFKPSWLRTAFAVFLIVSGLISVFSPKKQADK